MPTPRLGSLRERLVIQSRTGTPDGRGGYADTWSTVDTVPAELIPVRASERLQAQAIQAQLDFRFRIRARTDLLPTMRVQWTPSWPNGAARKTLQIVGIEPFGDGRTWTWLNCAVVE